MTRQTWRRSWWRACVTVIAALAVMGTIAACGSDDDDSSGGDSTTATTAKKSFTGKPVTLYFVGPLATPVADATDAYAAAQAAAMAINDEGGLNGHEVKVVACNETSANSELACARKAAAEGALGLVGSSFFFNAAPVDKVLQKAGIPSVAALAVGVPEFSSPINFPIDVPSLGVLACPQLMAEAADAKTISGIAQDLPVQVEVLKTIQGITLANKLEYGKSVAVPATQTDFSAAAKELGDSGADTVVNFLTPTAQGPLFTAANSLGEKFNTCASPAGFTVEVLKQLGTKAEGVYESLSLPPLSEEANVPLIKQFKSEIDAAADAGVEGAGTDELIVPANALRAWLGVQVIKQVAGDVSGELTSKSLLAALNKANVDLPGIGTLNFAKPGPGPGFERMFNPMVSLQKWDTAKGDFVVTDAKPVNILEVFASLQPK